VRDLDTKKNPKGGDEPPLEEVTFTFKKIEVQNTTAKSAAISSWEKPQS
jgi:type VI protein secretion system component Hcp